jgi:hypothetical protein
MAYIKGYQFLTEEQATEAVLLCNEYYGIPIEGDTTQNWCMYQVAELNTPIFWYIIYDESLLVVLGESTEFEVIYEDLSE